MTDMQDQIGFILCLDHEQAIGITIVTCEFLYFNYAKAKVRPCKLVPVTATGQVLDQRPQSITQVIEVQNRESRTVTYVVVNSDCYIDVFALDISGGVPAVVHVKKLKAQADTICGNLEEPSTFYISMKNFVLFATINTFGEQKVTLSELKIKYSDDKGDKTTALRHTFLKADTITSSTDSYLAIAYVTSDQEHFNLSI